MGAKLIKIIVVQNRAIVGFKFMLCWLYYDVIKILSEIKACNFKV